MFNTYNLAATSIRGTLLWHMRQQPQPNDFCKKSVARWKERSPGKRGQVRGIGD